MAQVKEKRGQLSNLVDFKEEKATTGGIVGE